MTYYTTRNNLETIIIFLYSLIPLTYITGPFLPDLILCIICVLFIIYSIRKKFLKDIIVSRFIYITLFINLYFIFTSINSSNILLSLESTIFYFRFFLFSLAIAILILSHKRMIIDLMFIILTFSFIILIISIAYELIFYKSIFGLCNGYVYSGKPLDRVSGLFCKDLIIGNYFARLSPIYAYLLYAKFSNSKNVYNLITYFLLVSLIIVFISGERAAFILSLINISIFILVLNRKIIKFLIPVFVVSFLFIFNSDNKKIELYKIRMIDSIFDIVDISKNNKIIFFTEGHEEIFKSAFHLYKSSPILGIGPKIFRNDCKIHNVTCSTHPHNYYIQLLIETGLIGLFLIFMFYSFLLLKFLNEIYLIVKNNKNLYELEKFFILKIFIISFFPLMPTSSFFNNYNSTILFFFMGFLIYLYKEKLIDKNLISKISK